MYYLNEKEKGQSIKSIKIERQIADHGPITKILYHRDVGLVISTFKGMVQVYDSIEFKLMWETSNYQRKEKVTISTFDYSQASGLIAVGGVEGKILMFDPSAKILTTSA